MRYTAQHLGRFSSGEGLPPGRTSLLGMQRSPVHDVRGVLIWSKEENLGVLSVRGINDGTLDTR